MGLPKIDITFEQLAKTAVFRSGRGVVALIVNDDTKDVAVAEYKKIPAEGEYSTENMEYIKMVFLFGVTKVIIARIPQGENTGDVDTALKNIVGLDWDWCAATTNCNEKIVAFIKEQRGNGRPYKAVVAGAAEPNCEGIVNIDATSVDYMQIAKKTYSGAQFCPYIAALLAALPLNYSATGYVLDNVVGVVADSEINGAIDGGKFAIVYEDGQYICARGVTSLSTAKNTPSVFKKIKHVEGADLMAKDISKMFRGGWRGKNVNSYENKQALCAEIISYYKDLTNTVLSPDFDNTVGIDYDAHVKYLGDKGIDTSLMSEIEILSADTGDTVFLKSRIQFIDVIEDLALSIVLN